MQRLEIKNFGPIKNVVINDIRDYMVFIGPQASGKSTIAKAVFFFKSLRDDLIKFTRENAEKNEFNRATLRFKKLITQKFLNYWGPTKHLNEIFLRYYLDEDTYITITLATTNSYVNVDFSKPFIEKFNDIILLGNEFAVFKNGNSIRVSKRELDDLEIRRQLFKDNIENLAYLLFKESRELIFIPAGRSLIATLSDQIQNITSRNLDFLMREFVERINNLKNFYSRDLTELIRGQIVLGEGVNNQKAVNLAEKYLTDILKGRYSSDSDGEKIYIGKEQNRYVKLNFASSGQQESLWILYWLFLIVLQNQSVLIVIEEPEAHLYPVAQKEITELITLVGNLNNNGVILTTHSPYILSSLNNLLYAHKVGKKHGGDIEKKINKLLWLDHTRLLAARVEKGGYENIFDGQLELIKSEKIDDASRIINETFDFIYDLDSE